MKRLVAALGTLAMLSGAAFAGSNLFFFAGSAGGTPGVGCANQLVLDYSNSCALIGQGWGQ